MHTRILTLYLQACIHAFQHSVSLHPRKTLSHTLSLLFSRVDFDWTSCGSPLNDCQYVAFHSSGVASASKDDSRDKQALLSMCPPQRQVQSRQRLPTTRQLASFKTPRHTLHASLPIWLHAQRPTRTLKPSALRESWQRHCRNAKVRGSSERRRYKREGAPLPTPVLDMYPLLLSPGLKNLHCMGLEGDVSSECDRGPIGGWRCRCFSSAHSLGFVTHTTIHIQTI